jgi:fructose-1,6-bisphosphatase/inositol monophosphatase family enzyme
MLDVLEEAATAVSRVLAGLDDWGPAGTREGQYRSDLAADDAVLAVLDAAGFGVLSEESGLHAATRDVLVVVDPVDGSTNAARGIPWFATSLCALDAAGPAAALVVNLASGTQFSAVRGAGAWRDGVRVQPSGCTTLGEAIVGLSGYPPAPFGWRQFRALGACALDLCAVACGWLDAYVDCSPDAHGVWDYLGGMLVCQEAGAVVAEAFGRELVVRDPTARRTPLAGGSDALLASIVAARTKLD